ncbi:MAG: von Willebrand factor type A domain-containing protein [bacterium]
MEKKNTGIAILTGTALLCGMGLVSAKIFGTTVSSKFNHASQSVVNEVTFGDATSYSYSSRPARQLRRAPERTHAVYPNPITRGESSAPTFHDYGTNPQVRTAVDTTSTFAADVDTASYAVARRALLNNMLPSPASVRVEEFVNAFAYRDPAPTEEALTAYLEAAPSPVSGEPDTYMLRIAVKAGDVTSVGRKPWNLTFLVDTSGSMQGPDRLGLVTAAIEEATSHLSPDDRVSLVTYAGNTRVVIENQRPSKTLITNALQSLYAQGGTDMGSGLELAYGLASQGMAEGRVSRVIVMSDGDANIGNVGHDAMLASISEYAKSGIKMTTVGVGDNFNDAAMEQLADNGDGNYVYLDDRSEVERVFGDNLAMWMQDVASDTKIQVEFDPAAVSTWRQIGYENRAMADSEFRNDKKDGGELGAGHSVTALYEIKLNGTPSDEMATVRLRYRPEGAKNVVERQISMSTKSVKRSLGQASDDLKFSAAVASFALMLKRAPEAKYVTPELIEELVSSGTGARAAEFANLVRQTKRLWARRA